MLLGKRPRHRMTRTTSLSEITFDLNTIENVSTHEAAAANSQPSDLSNNSNSTQAAAAAAAAAAGFLGQLDQRLLGSVPSPRNHRRDSAEFLETAHFLRSCSLCKRCLVDGRDIYMYRGDSAFCSLECRQQQMNQDERKQKCSLASKKEVAATSSTTQSQVSAEGETVAAV